MFTETMNIWVDHQSIPKISQCLKKMVNPLYKLTQLTIWRDTFGTLKREWPKMCPQQQQKFFLLQYWKEKAAGYEEGKSGMPGFMH